jgi:hypothetical protein
VYKFLYTDEILASKSSLIPLPGKANYLINFELPGENYKKHPLITDKKEAV